MYTQHFCVITITDHVGARFLHLLWCFGGQNNKVRHNMTKITSLLIVATVFMWVMVYNVYINFYRERGYGFMCKTKLYLCRNLFKLKIPGG